MTRAAGTECALAPRSSADAAATRGAAPDAAARRFDRPSRLSPAELASLSGALAKALVEIERDLTRALRTTPSLALLALEEVGADAFTSRLGDAPLALCFEVDGQPGWLAWERAAAVAVLECALGASDVSNTEPRALTAVECAALVRLIGGAVAKLARGAGLATSACRVAQDAESIGTWRRGGERADAHRLLARIAVDAPGGASELRLYLPGVGTRPSAPIPTRAPAALPPALAAVEVEVSARLGAADVPLAELLAIEVGDVIPLGAPVGAAVTVHVEDAPRLRGWLGRSGDRLAVRLIGVAAPADPPQEVER